MISPQPAATFGAGCFWGVETQFRRLTGVLRTSVGFMGGRTKNPTYDQVCIGNTGHAEVVQVVYEPGVIPYQSLLDCFWKIHDPTITTSPTGGLHGQYRSVIFYHTIDQRAQALASKEHHQTQCIAPIKTEVLAASVYTKADHFHQHYEEKQARRTRQ